MARRAPVGRRRYRTGRNPDPARQHRRAGHALPLPVGRTDHRLAWSVVPRQPRQTTKDDVAVGMRVASHPPHGSVRAELPHTALTLDEWRRSAAPGKDAPPWDVATSV